MQCASLVHSGRQNHYRSLVEDDLQVESQIANCRQYFGLVRLPCCNDGAPRGKRHLSFSQESGEPCVDGVTEEFLLASFRAVEHAAILHDDAMEQVQPREDVAQIRQMPAGSEDQFPLMTMLPPPITVLTSPSGEES